MRQSVCDAVSYFANVFLTDPCSMLFASSNSLDGLCPKAGLCLAGASAHLQSASVSEGLFAFELFEENTSAVVLSCGS